MLKTKYFIGSLIIASVLLSCSKTESFDIKGDPGIKFFFNNNPSFGNAPDNSISYNVVNIPDAASSGLLNLSSTVPDVIKFPVYATSPINDDVTIGAESDNSLIATYNAAHNTNYVAFPSGIFNTTGLIAHISKGNSTSADSISITSDASKFSVLTEDAYMAPIKLTTVSNAAGQITSSTTMVTYIIVNVEKRRIKYQATTADIQGAFIANKSTWDVTFNPALSTSGSILDGSTSSYSRWIPPVSPFGQVDINMHNASNVTGMRFYASSSATYVPTQVYVYLSNDGINYDLIGSPLKVNITNASGYNYILFYKAIAAQYIRLQLYYSTSTSSNNGRLAELDVYAN